MSFNSHSSRGNQPPESSYFLFDVARSLTVSRGYPQRYIIPFDTRFLRDGYPSLETKNPAFEIENVSIGSCGPDAIRFGGEGNFIAFLSQFSLPGRGDGRGL